MVSKCKKGYKMQDGKCIKKKGIFSKIFKRHEGKKHYNPLKMWGSYVGLVIILALVLFSNSWSYSIQNKTTSVCAPKCITSDCDEYGCRIDSACIEKCIGIITPIKDKMGKLLMAPFGITGPEGWDNNRWIQFVILGGVFVLYLFIGFFIGYGIHSLIRRIRK